VPGDDELAKVTLAHLRDPASICARRLAREHDDGRGHAGGTLRFAVSGRLEQCATLAQATMEPPRAVHFPTPIDLPPESQRVFATAARWYLAIFGDTVARCEDSGGFVTPRPDLGIRLVGPAGLRLVDEHGDPEVRLLRYGARHGVPNALLEDAGVRFALLRHAEWMHSSGRPVRVTVADLILGDARTESIDPTSAVAECEAWLAEQVAAIRERVADPVPTIGTHCAWCGFIGSCEALRP
jgi:hypothetical protein